LKARQGGPHEAVQVCAFELTADYQRIRSYHYYSLVDRQPGDFFAGQGEDRSYRLVKNNASTILTEYSQRAVGRLIPGIDGGRKLGFTTLN